MAKSSTHSPAAQPGGGASAEALFANMEEELQTLLQRDAFYFEAFKSYSLPAMRRLQEENVPGGIIADALRSCAMRGFLPDKHVNFITFASGGEKKVQAVVNYRALRAEANKQPGIFIRPPGVIRANDDYEHGWTTDENGTRQVFRHSAKLEASPEERGDIIGAFCAFEKNGNSEVLVLNRDYLARVRKSLGNKAQNEYSPWKRWPEEMVKKTAVKRVLELLGLDYLSLPDAVISTDKIEQLREVEDEYEEPFQDPAQAPPVGRAKAKEEQPPARKASGEDVTNYEREDGKPVGSKLEDEAW